MEISQLRSGWFFCAKEISSREGRWKRWPIPASLQDAKYLRTIFQPLRSWLISKVPARRSSKETDKSPRSKYGINYETRQVAKSEASHPSGVPKAFMTSRFILLVATLLICLRVQGQLAGVAKSQVAANVPDTENFRPFLIRDLTIYLKPIYGDNLTVGYELLRDGPTQSGGAYPKFYIWLQATNTHKMVIEGAVRVAAVDKKRFDVTIFVTRSNVISDPDALSRIFPQPVIEKILIKAGLKK